MAAYHGTVELAAGITPKNNGTFALVGAHDVQVDDDGNRLDTELTDLKGNLETLEGTVEDVLAYGGFAKYGVSGIGQSASSLTRILNSVGMTAQVGTDGDNSGVVNDFDTALPFMRRKCVGYWTKGTDRAIFHVNAYQGEAGYTEDGTNGDYVAVECPRCFYQVSGSTLVISAHKYEGFRAFDIFCHNHNQAETMEYAYLPAYALALNSSGKAVCLPGLDNCQESYKGLFDSARTYRDNALEGYSCIQPSAVNFYEWALFTVEFAEQNCQNVMCGCTSLRHNKDDRLTFVDSTHVLIQNYYASRVSGEYIAILPTNVDINSYSYLASHKITSIIRCNAQGTTSDSGEYQLATIEDLGKGYFEYDTTGATEYRIAGRPYRTGSCNVVNTPSGSPVSNSDGYYPMKYRWIENIYGNQHITASDLFGMKIEDGDSYRLAWYYIPKPEEMYPAKDASVADLSESPFLLLDVMTDKTNYESGYIKSKKYSSMYPDIWIPYETIEGSSTTYFADYAHIVYSPTVRSVRFGGYWTSGPSAGISYFYIPYAPSSAHAFFGSSLYMIQ